MRKNVPLAVLVCLVQVLCSANAGLCTTYQVYELKTPGGLSCTSAYDINDSNQIVGFRDVNSTQHTIYRWDGLVPTQLATDPADTNFMAYRINSLGMVAGYSDQHPYIWDKDGNRTQLEGTATQPYNIYTHGINSSGRVVGQMGSVGGWWEGTTWNPIVGSSAVYGINEDGVMVGKDSAGACLWDTDGVRHGLPGSSSLPQDVNASGDVVGCSSGELPALWQGSTLTMLPKLPKESYYYWGSGRAHAINDSGVIVGRWFDRDRWRFGACYWDGGGVHRLSAFPGDTSAIAYGINNNGWIVGLSGGDQAYWKHAVVWIPVPEPSSVLVLLSGMGGLAVAVRTRRRS